MTQVRTALILGLEQDWAKPHNVGKASTQWAPIR